MKDILLSIGHDTVSIYEIHRAVYARFTSEGKRQFLFAPVRLSDGRPGVIVRGEFEKGVPVVVPNEGDTVAFQLRAQPTVKQNGRRSPIARHKDDLRIRWLRNRGVDYGFTPQKVGVTHERVTIDKPGSEPYWLEAAMFSGTLRVDDRTAFLHGLENGMGRGRAWGMGLMLISKNGN